MAELETRLATRTTQDVSQRLRLTAVLRGKQIAELLTEVLDGALPSAADLGRQLSATDQDRGPGQ
jgi:uncharacterized protein (DUF2342 family)